MKALFCVGLFLLGLRAADLLCNTALLQSYDIESADTPTGDHNLLCKSTVANCCPYQAQLTIYKKWVVQQERDRFIDFYATYKHTLQDIFDSFADIEEIAGHIKDLTEEVEGSNCHRMAATITRFHVSTLKAQVVEAAKRASKFFYESRQGFYCALCDAQDHLFFDLRRRTFGISEGFCRRMVDQTINYALFRYNAFIKFARLYATFAFACDATGRFRPQKILSNDLKFFRRDDFMGDVEACKGGIRKDGDIKACYAYCEWFNPVRLSEVFEGEVDKLAAYSAFLEKRAEVLGHQLGLFADRELSAKPTPEEDAKNKKPARVLVDGGAAVPPEELTELARFNSDYKTVLLRPMVYSYKQDMTLRLHVNYEDSVMKLGEDPLADIMEFGADVEDEGIDFQKKGFEALIDKETASRVFEQLYPDPRSAPDLQTLLKSI